MKMMGLPLDSALGALAYVGSGVRDIDHLAYLDYMHAQITAAQLRPAQRLARARELESYGEDKMPFYCVLTSLLAPALGRAVKADLQDSARLRAARAAMAVERYRLAEDALPDALGDLVPGYLDAVPTDPFDGASLRYRKLDKGYVVYSIGDNGTDDGGEEQDLQDMTFIVER